MASPNRLFVLLGLIASGFFLSTSAYAECGGNTQCIAVGATAADARVAHHGSAIAPNPPESSTFTLDFGSQTTATTSATKTVYVAAVTGPPNTMAILGPIALRGTDAADFLITGGTCSPANGPVQDAATGGGTLCTVTVAFKPGTVGTKTATLSVPLNPPACVGCIVERTLTVTGTGALAPPVISSALAASGQAGVPFPGYQIAASNNPTSFTASPLPTGLAVNTSSGAITGTPTSNGTFNTTITATNAAGTDTKTLVFTISPSAPAITSASTASGKTGQAFSYQITATNNPTSFTASPLPPGLIVNNTTGAISGTPTAGGVYIVSVTATNATGTASQSVTIAIDKVVPAVQNLLIEVSLNTPKTFDLAMDTLATGIEITANPAHGTAVISGTKVTYTPVNNYFGPDAFTYLAIGNDGKSPTAVVTITVVGRPDPSRDAAVRGLLGSQADVARRFSRSQISNFQRRMESLHRSASATPSDTAAFAPGLISGYTGAASATVSAPLAYAGNNALAQAGGNFLLGKSTAPDGLRVPGEPNTVSPPSAFQPISYLTTIASVATSRTLNLAAVGERFDGSSSADNTGFWMGGGINFGTRDQNGINTGSRFGSDGVSVGLDHRFSDTLALGLGLGFVRDRTDIGLDGTQNRTKGASVTAYGSYQLSPKTYIDALLGYGSLTYDSVRYVAPINAFAFGARKGNQVFGSISAAYEYRDEGLLIAPYGRLDVGMNRLKQGSETGAGLFALTYYDQSFSSVQAALGLRAESRHATNFGWAMPRMRIELKHDFQGGSDATISYADQFAGPRYSVSPVSESRDAILVGIGSDLVLRNGLKLGADYQVQRSFGPERSHVVRLWLSKDLDGKGISSGLLPTARMFASPVRVEGGFTFDNNINRVRESVQKLADHIYTLGVSTGTFFPLGNQSRFALNGFINGDKFRTYSGLDRLSGGVQGEFQYRTSAEFDAVTLGLFGRATLDAYQSDMRDGNRFSVGFNARQALTDRIDIFGAVARNKRDARSDVFDGRDYSARLNLDYSLGRNGVIYLGGEYRRGDSVSSGLPTAASGAIATVFAPDDAYSGTLVAYRYDARTVLWTVGYNWPLGPRDSLDFSWRHARSTPTKLGPFAGTAYGVGIPPDALSSYTADQFSIAYLMRF